MMKDNILLYLSLLLLLLHNNNNIIVVHSKTVTGDFKLSGVNTEQILTSFAVVPDGAKIDITFETELIYENEQELFFRAIRDTEWSKYQKQTLCTDRIKLSKYNEPIRFTKKDAYVNDNKKYIATIENYKLQNIVRNKFDRNQDREEAMLEKKTPRNHYWYFIVTDCTLEVFFHDNRIPEIHYNIQIQNYLPRKRRKGTILRISHISADQVSSTTGHAISFLSSMIVAAILFLKIIVRFNSKSKHHTVHAAVVWVAIASSFDSLSSFFELLHLQSYSINGIGSYSCDAISAYFEAVCDGLLMILLLSIAAGWTLPSSVVTVINTNANPVQQLLTGLSHPITSGIQSKSGYFAISIILLHIILAQWGRIYNDEFESYHDLEHIPGKILMWIRVFGGILFLAAVKQTTSNNQHCPPTLYGFYKKFTIAGFFWFISLPLITWICNIFVPYYKRQPIVFLGASTLQSGSIIILSWLVTSHRTAYHKYSRMSITEESLTENLSTTTTTNNNNNTIIPSPTLSPMLSSPNNNTIKKKDWFLGKKAKVCLD